ncbi:BnaA01g23910D [Brassica napus]|uniref:BnaA01g23910D protein n=1 Tax=Brassica napus TaxID=3708 RepID=A0A078HCT3_BRANA|nr:BnaA01g23910D [Brassica napus]
MINLKSNMGLRGIMEITLKTPNIIRPPLVHAKKKRVRGPLDMKDRKSFLGACDKDLKETVCGGITRWVLDAGLVFNAVNCPSFGEMIKSVQIEENKNKWASKGCSLMSDGWHDSVAKKDIVNVLVNSPKYSVFMKLKDISEVVKDATLLFKMLYEMVEEIGEAYVVQIITDNAKSYIKSDMYDPNQYFIFNTPYAAHCIYLMLEDIEEIPALKNAMKNASKESAHTSYKKFLKQQKPLRDMVNFAEWSESKWPKEAGAKKIRQYPIDMAKETIAKDFKWNKEKYEKAFEIIDKRWECQLHHPLHAAGYFLNPSIHYKYHDDVCCEEVEGGLYNCITRSVFLITQDKIMAELDAFKNSTGIFGHGMASRQRDIKAPALKRRSTRSDSVTTDPIILDEIDESNEWLIGRMDGDSSDNDDMVWEDDDLPWNVESAEEPNYSTRGATGTSTSKTKKGKGVASSNQKKRYGPSQTEKLLEEKGTRLDKRLPTLIIKASTFVHHGAWLEPSRLRTPCGI